MLPITRPGCPRRRAPAPLLGGSEDGAKYAHRNNSDLTGQTWKATICGGRTRLVGPALRTCLPNSLRVHGIRDIDLIPGSRHPHPKNASGGQSVNQLIAYLLDHAMLDFSGDLTLEMIRDFLRNDDSPAAKALLGKLVQERGVDDMVVTLADCLQEYLRAGLSEEVVRDQIKAYAES